MVVTALIATAQTITDVSGDGTDQKPLRLKEYSVHKVKLSFPYKMKSSNLENGEEKVYETAWLVKLELENMPTTYGPKIDFFVGEYKIPEYGGWKDGIYFRIYDEKVLEMINGQQFFYQKELDAKPISLIMSLNVEDPMNMDIVAEKDVFKR